MIRVAANLAWLTPGRVGGSEEYTVRLLEGVIAADPHDIALEIHGSRALQTAHPRLSDIPFHTISGPVATRPYRLWAESTVVHRRTRSADLVHHFGGRVPKRRHGNDVVTIHDLQPLDLAENFSALRTAYLRRSLPNSAHAARHICTPSQWVADSVCEAFGIDSDRVTAISSSFGEVAAVDDSIATRLGSGPVVLYPAMTHPHKNHDVLLRAMEIVSASRPDAILVLTGAPGRSDAKVRASISTSSATVLHAGRVSVEALQGLYQRADVVAFPSRYEGFGLPVLEAFAHQRPVVAANAAALPEVVGEAGVLVDPDDAAAWAIAIDQAIESNRAGTLPIAAMQARLDLYSPARAAERLMDVWRSLRSTP